MIIHDGLQMWIATGAAVILIGGMFVMLAALIAWLARFGAWIQVTGAAVVVAGLVVGVVELRAANELPAPRGCVAVDCVLPLLLVDED